MCDWVDSAETTTGAGESISASDPQLRFLQELVDEHATIAGDVIEIALDELSTAQDRAARR